MSQDNAALKRRRDYAGPVLFSYGFRPFFLGAGIWAAIGIMVWLPQYLGMMAVPTAFSPLDWHIHEMLYGYVAASIAGFLLTAVPNWTGRLPVNGAPLMALAALWLAGRIVILGSDMFGAAVAAVVDISFLVALAAVAAREIIAGKNWRNLRVLVILGVLIAGNIVFHAEVMATGAATYGPRIAIAAIIMLITIIGGRIVPSFTHNWLVRNNPGRLPVPFARFDVVAIAVSAVALVLWVIVPLHQATGGLLLAAGILQSIRLARWAGDRTWADRLVTVLHIAYAFVPIGFLLGGASVFLDVPPSAGIHAWSAGTMGMMTLAVMTRATLGHTGRPLVASPSTQVVYALILLAVLLRIIAAMTGSTLGLEIAGVLWIAGFAGFVALYAPLLAGRPPAWAQEGR